MSELSDRLKRLSKRGTERGADAVFAAAQASTSDAPVVAIAPTRSLRKLQVATAIAATITLVGGVAAAIRIGGNSGTPASHHRSLAAPGTTTTGAPETTSTTTSPATKVYLASTRLVPFDQCPSLARYAQNKALAVVGPYGLPGSGGGGVAYANDAKAAAGGRAEGDAATPSAPALAQTDDHSTTNVQEAGIDEPDTVKTDGKTIFTVANGKVYATSAGANPTVLDLVPVDGASDLFLVGDRLIVISGASDYSYATDTRPGGGLSVAPNPRGNLMSRFSVLDVSNPADMKSAGSFNVDGSYVSARLVDGVARIVVQSYPQFQFAYPTDNTPEAQAAAAQHNHDVVQAATVNSWLPHFSFTTGSGTQGPSKPLGTCANSYRPPNFSGFGTLSVISFNATSPADSHTTSVMADGDMVYASATRLYVATNQWGEVTPDNVVQPTANTLIHAFNISDSSNATYLFSGKVRGTVLNQFSMSEYHGAFRVATTDSNGGSESFLTVLGDSGNALIPVGQVGGLGKGERIYGVRFIDATAYIVTFRQTDPLYVVDLSEPTKPKVVGELALTGYSAYLHPIGPGLLLGIGVEADANGMAIGIQASTFDVTNPAAPKLVARKVLERGHSSAEFDHHAFLYWPATKLAVLPINTYDPSGQTFNGAVGLHIGDASIDEVGRVQPPVDPQQYAGIDRTLVIGGRLYATSQRGIVVATLDTLSQTAWAPYPS